MDNGIGRGVFVVLAICEAAWAADIRGTVIIEHQLTPRTVTAPAGSYLRGTAVELGAPETGNALSWERAHVVVYLEGELPSTPVAARMEQKNRSFTPDLVLVPAGSTVTFPNLDVIFHNVFSLSRPATFDLGNYPKGQTRTVTFPKPGIVYVNCRLHPNMAGVIVVSPNSRAAIAGKSGKFVLSEVPPGVYTVVAWHKAAGFFRLRVQVSETQGAEIEFFIPRDASGLPKSAARR
jgi:plastocyanin